jgi:hypothetical protein
MKLELGESDLNDFSDDSNDQFMQPWRGPGTGEGTEAGRARLAPGTRRAHPRGYGLRLGGLLECHSDTEADEQGYGGSAAASSPGRKRRRVTGMSAVQAWDTPTAPGANPKEVLKKQLHYLNLGQMLEYSPHMLSPSARCAAATAPPRRRHRAAAPPPPGHLNPICIHQSA